MELKLDAERYSHHVVKDHHQAAETEGIRDRQSGEVKVKIRNGGLNDIEYPRSTVWPRQAAGSYSVLSMAYVMLETRTEQTINGPVFR